MDWTLSKTQLFLVKRLSQLTLWIIVCWANHLSFNMTGLFIKPQGWEHARTFIFFSELSFVFSIPLISIITALTEEARQTLPCFISSWKKIEVSLLKSTLNWGIKLKANDTLFPESGKNKHHKANVVLARGQRVRSSQAQDVLSRGSDSSEPQPCWGDLGDT